MKHESLSITEYSSQVIRFHSSNQINCNQLIKLVTKGGPVAMATDQRLSPLQGEPGGLMRFTALINLSGP